jgi:transcriptional regulator with XRE-family HTH domain
VEKTKEPLSLNQVLAINCKKLRARRNLTQEKLAVKLGRPRPRVAELEAASTDCRLSTLQAFAKAFNVSPQSLLKEPDLV